MFAKDHDCSDELKSAHLKVTPARIAALKLFEIYKGPIDSLNLIEDLQKKLNSDRVTVFRILNTFLEKGLIRKLEFGEGKARYELNLEDHHHLVCQNCGSIEDVSDCNIDTLEKEIAVKKKFLIKNHSLEFFGLCIDCQK